MFTPTDIEKIIGLDSGYAILENPSNHETDPALSLIAERMVQFQGNIYLNPNNVVIGDFDIATVMTDDPVNLTDFPQFYFVTRHKKTKLSGKFGILSRKGWMVPFNIVKDFSVLAKKEK